jgi:hypothetical protein
MATATKTRWRMVLWLFVGVVICFALLLADSMGWTYFLVRNIGDAMDWRSHFLAGLGSVNCGRVGVRESTSSATQCALEANAKARPFRVIYNIQGFDESVAGGIVRTPHGRLLALSYYGCPSGCGFSLLQQRVHVASCPQPYHLYVNPKGRINCFQPELSYPQNLMSPNAEPY